MGGGSTTTDSSQQTQSNQTTQLPPWINTAAQQNYAYAQNLATQPLQQYQGQLVADVGPQMQQAWNTAASGANAGADQYNASQAGYLGVMGQTPQQVAPSGTVNPSMINTQAPGMQVSANQVTDPGNAASYNAAQLSNTNLNPYMNPYTQSVINTTLPIMQQNLGLSQNQQQNAANSANAFGGSRQAIQQGVTQAQGALGMGQMAAQLNQANFGQAQAAAQSDVAAQNTASQANQANQQANLARAQQAQQLNQAANLQAGLANQNVGLQGQQLNQAAGLNAQQFNLGQTLQSQLANQSAQQNQAGLNVQAASGLGVLGQQAQLSQTRDFTEQQTAGALEQQQAQNEINAQIANYQQAWQYPYQNLGVLQSALGMTPYGEATQGQSTTQGTSTTTQSPGIAQAALGGIQSLGSMFGAQGMFGAAGAFAGLPGSDRRLKTDIKREDTHPSGLPIYSYRYKGDPKTYPKVLGPMAEDVAKIAPHAVKSMGAKGRLAIDMNALPGGTPSVGGMRSALPPSVGGLNPGLPPTRALAPMIRPTGPSLPQPSMGRDVGAGMRQGAGPPAPGPLSAPGVAGTIGALGSTNSRPRRVGSQRMPPIRGALGG